MPVIFEQLFLFYRYAVRRRWTVLVFAWLFCLAGWAIVVLLPSQYQSVARVYADTDSLLTPLVTGLAPDRQAANQLDALEETLLSRTNLEVVVDRSGFELDADRREAAVAQLAATISIDSEGGNLFTIAFTHGDPWMAHRVVDSLLETVLADELALDRQDVGPAQNFIQRQIDLKRSKLETARTELSDYQKQNVDILTGQNEFLRNLDAAQRRLAELEADINAAKARQGELTRRLASLPATVAAPSNGPSLIGPQAELRDLTQRLNELRNRFTDQHPDVIATERALAVLQEQIRNGGGPAAPVVANPLRAELQLQQAELDAEIASLENREIQARRTAGRLGERAAELPEAQAELTRLTNAYELVAGQLNDLQERQESARIVGDLGGRSEFIDFRVVDPANRPKEPSSPPRLLLMIMVLLAGLMAGVAVAISAGVVQNPFESGRPLHELYGLPVLGSVSRIVPPERRFVHKLANFSFGAGCLALVLAFVVIIQAENRQIFSPWREDVVENQTEAGRV